MSKFNIARVICPILDTIGFCKLDYSTHVTIENQILRRLIPLINHLKLSLSLNLFKCFYDPALLQKI